MNILLQSYIVILFLSKTLMHSVKQRSRVSQRRSLTKPLVKYNCVVICILTNRRVVQSREKLPLMKDMDLVVSLAWSVCSPTAKTELRHISGIFLQNSGQSCEFFADLVEEH